MGEDNNDKIVLATRAKEKADYEDCKNKLKTFANNKNIAKFYIIHKEEKSFDIDGMPVQEIYDPYDNPNRPTAFNLVIDKLKEEEKENGNKYHLLTFSKEVELRDKDIEEMLREIKNNPSNLIVAGFPLKDNVLSDEERKLYSNGGENNKGIAYKIPWSTCALWNKNFVYEDDFEFDEICEKEGNQLGELEVKIDGKIEKTDYKGMEDGLLIAKLKNKNPDLGFELLDKDLPWVIMGDDKRIKDHKKKMARKNIVLTTFMNIKGYSIDALRDAGKGIKK